MRQLRQPARSDRSDQPALADRRARCPSSARRSTCSSICRSSPTGCGAGSRRTTTGGRTSRTSRSACSTRFGRARSRATSTGASGSRSRLRRGREQAHLRLVRRRDRLPLGVDRMGRRDRRSRRLAGVVAEPGRRALLLPGQGQHRLPHRDLAGDAARLRPGRLVRRRPRRARPAVQRGRDRVLDLLRQAVLDEPRALDLRPRLPRTLRPGRAALLPRRGQAPRPRTPTSPGRSSSAATTTSCSRTGATSSTARSRTPTALSARSRSRAS